MKIFDKISASRSPMGPESVMVKDIYFETKEIISKKDVDEFLDFIKENCPHVFGGSVFHTYSFSHFFGNSQSLSKKMFYALTLLRDNKGKSLFDLEKSPEGLQYIVSKNTGISIDDIQVRGRKKKSGSSKKKSNKKKSSKKKSSKKNDGSKKSEKKKDKE